MNKKSVLVFGVGELQKSIIKRAKDEGLFVVGIDPNDAAFCKNDVDAFEVVGGQDFEQTLNIAKKYSISAVLTAATDKPLVMMARVAKELNLPFYSIETAIWSTDKLLMKEHFDLGNIPHAKGCLINSFEDFKTKEWCYPVIVKPRDNSGSRGVIYCSNEDDVKRAIQEALSYTKKESILVEEFIDGPEFSIESLHYNGNTHVIQFTQKQTTEFPYNVELGHIQPAELTEKECTEIRNTILRIAECMNYDNCASHTELKISSRGIVVIETSPRLGGDFITSKLTPLSTGVNMEQLLIHISIGEEISDNEFKPNQIKSSGIVFFELPEGKISSIGDMTSLKNINGIQVFNFEKKVGDEVNKITSSLNRYGYAIFQTSNRKETISAMKEAREQIKSLVNVSQ